MLFSSGSAAGEPTRMVSPFFSTTSYSTEGAVMMISRSYSRSSRSWMISMWNIPRKPQRKPKFKRLGGLRLIDQ